MTEVVNVDWTGAFAVIGAAAVFIGAAVAVSGWTVAGWVGVRHLWELYVDEQRQLKVIEDMRRSADETLYGREQRH